MSRPLRGTVIRSMGVGSGGDSSRQKSHFAGFPRNWVSRGIVGHEETTPQFVREEAGKILVEVTIVPSGEEIVAELADPGGGNDFALYMPVRLGMRVLVVWVDGVSDNPVIVSRLTDSENPLPGGAAGVTSVSNAPQFAFIRTPSGTILSIESGEGSDVVIKSGGSVQISVGSTEQILLNGETHLGGKFSSAPQGAGTGPSGEILPGSQGGAYATVPYAPVPYAPGTIPPFVGPKNAIVRVGDQVSTDITVDPTLFAWFIAVHAIVQPLGAVMIPPIVLPPTPISIGSHHKTASKTHTATD